MKEVLVLPIYEYECMSCGERFDEMQKLSDPPLTECKLCKGKVRKLLGTPALQFKGSGWYITDYAGKNAANNGSASKDSAKDAAASDKPEAKAEKPAAAPSCSCSGNSCGNSGK